MQHLPIMQKMRPYLKYLSAGLLLLSMSFPLLSSAQSNTSDGMDNSNSPEENAASNNANTVNTSTFNFTNTNPNGNSSFNTITNNPTNNTNNNSNTNNVPVMVSGPSASASPTPAPNSTPNPNATLQAPSNTAAAIPGRYSSGGASLVRCDGVVTSSGEVACDFNYLIKTVNYIIDWIFGLSIPIAVGILAYAGILYMTGIEKNINKAKSMFEKVAIGFAIMLVAFIAVSTAVGWLVRPGQGFGTLIGQ